MLYIVGKIFLNEISFNILNNESRHKNMEHFEKSFFTERRKKYQSFLNRDVEALNSPVLSNAHIHVSNK